MTTLDRIGNCLFLGAFVVVVVVSVVALVVFSVAKGSP